MSLLYYGVTTILLILVMYQDMRYRAVSWLIFPVLALLFIAIGRSAISLSAIAGHFMIAISFLLVQGILVITYFSIRHKRFINIFDNYIGAGDVLFLVCIGFLFSPLNYLFFYLMSLSLALAGTLLMRLIPGIRIISIPLAGIQAFLLALWMNLAAFSSSVALTSDQWILHKWLL